MKKVEVTGEKINAILRKCMAIDIMVKNILEMALDISKLVENKNHDYGNAWQRYGIFTPLIRINDKILRLKTLVGKDDFVPALVADEKIEDTLKDIIGYAALALLWLKEEDGNEHNMDGCSGVTSDADYNHTIDPGG